MYRIARGVFVLLGIGLVVAIAPAHAIEPDTIYSPRVQQGEWELEYKGRYFYDRDSNEHRQSQSKMALGYGPTSYGWTELYAEYEYSPGSGGGWSAFEWENRFQFTEPGQDWVARNGRGAIGRKSSRWCNGRVDEHSAYVGPGISGKTRIATRHVGYHLA